MEQLPGADTVFLSLETPNAPAHVGGLTILDTSESPDFSFEKLLATIDERIRLEPRFTRKLRELPLGFDRPYLVDDPDFDVRRHVHRIAAPTPGGLRELAELASYLHSRALDRDRPLWELWFIEGVEGGRCAMLMKSHHCLMDGMAGANLGELLCDLQPDPPPRAPAPDNRPDQARSYGDLEIGLRAAIHLAQSPGKMLGFGARMLRQTGGMLMASRNEGAPPLPMFVPATRFNGEVGPRRAFSCASVSLDDVKAVKNRFGVTINDVMLALTGAALRTYLETRDELPDQSLVAVVAVSKRSAGDDEIGNQVTMVPCVWATDEPDPVERLLQIHRNAKISKDLSANYDADMTVGLGESMPPGLASLLMRTAGADTMTTFAPGNVVVSNVRGTPVPLYVAGARIETMYPLSLLAPSQRLNITVVSYMGKVDVGFVVDADAMDDVWCLAEEVPKALRVLLVAAGRDERRERDVA
ncbi:MAG: wax ester/triacylglycerol synthase family O-acyltransferase [Deltaproteobacteria bacterium]|nr:wax ester/triacylglycerol synthase family O-acyltransferase [Deltaproteobacteria bacterium]MBW2393321.1 wax ester/triacylglycerol synthase family O-acyltransferase [Deltaproteobacteria bacterium]